MKNRKKFKRKMKKNILKKNKLQTNWKNKIKLRINKEKIKFKTINNNFL